MTISDGGPTPTTAVVRPADILFFAGHSRLAWATRRLEGAEIDHAAIALGNGLLSEVTPCGVVVTALPEMVERHRVTFVCRPVNPVDEQVAMGAIRQFLTRPVWYAHQPVVLLALLCLTRPLPWRNPTARRLVRTVLERATGLLRNLADHGRTHLFCSDYVARCHPEVTPRRPVDGATVPDARTYVDVVRELPQQAPTQGRLARWLPRQPQPTSGATEADLEPLVLAFAADQSGGTGVEPLGTGPEPLGTPSRIDSADLVAAGVAFRDLLLATSASPVERTGDAWDDLARFAAATVTPAGLLASPDLTVVEELRS